MVCCKKFWVKGKAKGIVNKGEGAVKYMEEVKYPSDTEDSSFESIYR